jgi:oxalate decarboxylase/phosphoglucose isomerase-like protein (cupin superfamily)
METIEIIHLSPRSDQRGRVFSLPAAAIAFLDGIIAETHMAEVLPGFIRGNHWHDNRWEVILATGQDSWQFYWSEGPEDTPQCRDFAEGEAVAILIPPYTPHAIKNTGVRPLWVTAIANGSYDGVTTDTYAAELI